MNASEVRTLFANSVRQWRHRRRLTQEELAERSNLHRTYISDVERGARNLSLESIDKLARALDVPIPALFGPVPAPGSPGSITALPPASEFVELLLVEDNKEEARQVLEAFARTRFVNPVHVATDGEQALDYVFHNGVRKPPEEARRLIVLLDLQLSKVSGLEVLRRLKSDERTREIPVVVLTGSEKEDEVVQCRRLGAKAIITKPLSFRGLCQVAPALDVTWAMLKPLPETGD